MEVFDVMLTGRILRVPKAVADLGPKEASTRFYSEDRNATRCSDSRPDKYARMLTP